MATHFIKIDGQNHTLTTEHPYSQGGQPVLLCGTSGDALGPDQTCRLRVEDCTDEALAILAAAGFEFDDCRESK